MTRLEALIELRDKVMAGALYKDSVLVELETSEQIELVAGDDWGDFCSAYDGHLDAAKALHEAVLPGWQWIIDGENRKLERNAQAQVWKIRKSKRKSHIGRVIASHNPARAWLLAILEALIAQEKTDDQ